jgi:hypothetical protein
MKTNRNLFDYFYSCLGTNKFNKLGEAITNNAF